MWSNSCHEIQFSLWHRHEHGIVWWWSKIKQVDPPSIGRPTWPWAPPGVHLLNMLSRGWYRFYYAQLWSNFKSLKTHLGLTYLDGRAVASGPFIRTSLRCCRGLLGWRNYFSLPYLLGFCPCFWFSLLFGVRQGNNCSQLCSQDHWALVNFWLEVEFLLGPIDGELNFSGSNINMCLGCNRTAQIIRD